MKINQINLPEFLFFEYFQDFFNQICSLNQNKDFVISFDDSIDFFEFKKFFRPKNSFDSDFLSRIMMRIFLFFKNDFSTKDLISFLFENQNLLSKKYKFFFNFGFNSVNFDENSLIEDFFEIEFIKTEFLNIKKRIFRIIEKIKSFFESYYKNHEIKHNFKFFFLCHLNLLKKFLFEFFDLENHSLIFDSIQFFQTLVLQNFDSSPLMSFEIYLMIFEKEILKKKYENFHTNEFEILNFEFSGRIYDFFCVKENSFDLDGKNLLIISKDLDGYSDLLCNLNCKQIIIFKISDETEELENRDVCQPKEDEQINEICLKSRKKLNSFDLFDLFFQQEKFFVSKILEKDKRQSFLEKKIEFLPEKFFEKIIFRFFEIFSKEDNELCNSNQIFEKFLKNIAKEEIFFKSDQKIGTLIFDFLENPLKIFSEVFFEKIIKPKKKIFFEKLEFEISQNFILESKDFLFEINEFSKKIEIFNFFYDKFFVQKDFLELRKKLEFALQYFLLKKKYENFELEMNFFVFNLSPKRIQEIKFNNQISQNLVLNFEKKLESHLNQILNFEDEKN